MSRPTFINSKVVYHDNSREYNIDARGRNLAEVLRACDAEEIEQIEDITPSTEQPITVHQQQEIELFKYIHPSVTDDEERLKIHKEVINLVTSLPIPDICRYLMEMRKHNRVYLNVQPEAMFEELHRLGMPDENTRGFSKNNFLSYFNVK